MKRPELWTAEEIAMLRNNIVPPTRSERSARTKAFKLCISFCPGGCPESKARNLTEEQKCKIVDRVRETGNRTNTAREFKVSRNYVIELCKAYGVKMMPSPHDRLGEHIEYDGHNFSWKKGSWICTSSIVRATGKYNLGKILWEKYHGTYPDSGHDVRFKDGDRYNLRKSNLELLTKSQAQTLRLKDPKYREMNYASGCLGLLMVRIEEMLDPAKKAERLRRMAETTRRLHPDRGRKTWETRRRNAERLGYYFTDEQKRKMSEAHKGKPGNHRKDT